jgi:voltage-gated potassium channel
MGLAHQVAAAAILVALTLWLQCAGMGVLIYWTKGVIERRTKKLTPWHSAMPMIRFAAAMIVLQILEILVWACFYRWKCLPSWEPSFYFSTASYSTVGYGDVLLPRTWRPWDQLRGLLQC